MASEAERLDQITQTIHTVLEERLTSLLADIQAVREVADLIGSTDADITRRELLKDQLLARMEASSGPARDDLHRRVATEDEAVSNLTLLRADLTNTLQSLADELRSGEAS